MATRATYNIDGKTFYIHYDGYLEGAANYFYDALVYENERSGLAGKFFRANELAEFTVSHVLHGDTDYRYTVKDNNIIAKSYDYRTDSWSNVYNGNLIDFVNQYAPQIQKDLDLKFKKVKIRYSESYHNSITVTRVLKDKVRTLKIWLENGHNSGANWDSLIEQIKEIKSNFIEIESIKEICNEFITYF